VSETPDLEFAEAADQWKTWVERQIWEVQVAKHEALGDVDRLALAEEILADTNHVPGMRALEINTALIQMLNAQQWQAVQAARREGASWDEIGTALGITRQSAWTKFSARLVQEEEAAAERIRQIAAIRADTASRAHAP
jgi:hypothetical protein